MSYYYMEVEKEAKRAIYSLTQGDAYLFAELKVGNKYIKNEIAKISDRLDIVTEKMHLHDQKLRLNMEKINNISKKSDSLEDLFANSPLKQFVRSSWWKVGTFIISWSIILGWLGDYLYRLPAPK